MNGRVLLSLGLILLIFFYLNNYYSNETSEIQVHYYDADGNEIIKEERIYFSVSGIEESIYDEPNTNGDIESEDLIDNNLENGLPTLIEDDENINTKESFFSRFKNLFAITSKSTTIYSSYTDTYCEDSDNDYDYDGNVLDDIGADELSSGYETCNGMMRFDLRGLPSDLKSIEKVYLNFYTDTSIMSDEGNGATTDFGIVTTAEGYDWSPDDDSETSDCFYILEQMSSSPYYLFTIDFQENQENLYFSRDISTSLVKSEIMKNRFSSNDYYLPIGIEGEMDSNDDEKVDIVGGSYSNRPSITVYYTSGTSDLQISYIDKIIDEVNPFLVHFNIVWTGGAAPYLISFDDITDYSGSNTKEFSTSNKNYNFDFTFPSSGTKDVFVCVTTDYEESCMDFQVSVGPTTTSLDVLAQNNGGTILNNVKIVDASPIEFKNALNLNDVRNLNPGQSSIWKSSVFDIPSSWGSSELFSVTMSGVDVYDNEVIVEISSKEVTF